MTKKIMLSTVAVSMISSMAAAGTLQLQGTPYTIAEEVVRGGAMSYQMMDISRLMHGAVYTAAIPNGGSVNDPSILLYLSDSDLYVPSQFEQNNIPAFCYEDPTNLLTGYTAIAVYDHTEQYADSSDQLIFRSFSNTDAVSNNNEYILMEIENAGDTACVEPTWEMYTSGVADCDPQNDAILELWDANNVQVEYYIDQAIDAEIFDVIREFTITLAAKTFGEIKVSEWVDVRNGEAPIVDHAERTPNDDASTTTSDIHTYADDTALAYFLLPHDIILNNGYYNYYMDPMDLPMQADPIAWYISITPADMIDYSVQTDSNSWWMHTDFTGTEPGNVPGHDHGVDVMSWWTDAGSLVPGNECSQYATYLDCYQTMPMVSGNEYFGVAWYGGLQNQTLHAINPSEFESYVEFSNIETTNGYIRIWPYDYNADTYCPAELPAEDTGYWQTGGFHVVVPVKNNARVSSVLRISNGLTQTHTDRLNRVITDYTSPINGDDALMSPEEGIIGWNDETNIARTADVYFRMTNGLTGEVTTVYGGDAWKIGPNMTLAVNVAQIMQMADPAFGDDDLFMGTAEVFVNNDPKNVKVDALENVKGSTDARTLSVNSLEVVRQHSSF